VTSTCYYRHVCKGEVCGNTESLKGTQSFILIISVALYLHFLHTPLRDTWITVTLLLIFLQTEDLVYLAYRRGTTGTWRMLLAIKAIKAI
jgi:hypothetical protein